MEKDIKQTLTNIEKKQKQLSKKIEVAELAANNGNYTYTEPRKDHKK